MKEDLHFGASKRLIELAKELRKNETETEKLLWKALRNRHLHGIKFRRQHPVYNYIVDFYCHDAKLAVEVDGKIHQNKENKEYDVERTQELNNFGITVLRFTNSQIEKNTDFVLDSILTTIEELKSSP